MKIQLEELDLLLNTLIKKAEKLNINDFELEQDYYWNIDSDSKYNMKVDPELNVGSLFDDWKSLVKAKESDEFTNLDFERLGNLLIYFHEYLSKSDKIF